MGNVHMEATQINFRGGASKMNVEEAIKSAIELTPEQKTNINKIPTIEAAVATKTDQTVIAPEFDAESGTYAIGDMVMHEGKLYEFTSAHETAGDWNAEEVSEKTVSDEIDTLKSGLTNYYFEKDMSGNSSWTATDIKLSKYPDRVVSVYVYCNGKISSATIPINSLGSEYDAVILVEGSSTAGNISFSKKSNGYLQVFVGNNLATAHLRVTIL